MRKKTLVYERAVWLNRMTIKRTGEPVTLQYVLRRLLKDTESPQERSVVFGASALEVRHMRLDDAAGVFLHIVRYTPGEEASVVPLAEVNGDLGTAKPPEKSEYMDGDIMALVNGNDIFIVQNNLRSSALKNFVAEAVLVRSDIPDKLAYFETKRIAKLDKVKLIQEEGVSELDLRADLYMASVLEAQRGSQSLLSAVAHAVEAFTQDDVSPEQISADENLQVGVTIKFRKRGGTAIDQRRLQRLAVDAAEDEEIGDGFRIKTLAGNSFGRDDIIVVKKENVSAFGKSVDYLDAWSKLSKFRLSLERTGALVE